MAETFFGLTDTGRQRQNNEDTFIAIPVLKDAFIAVGVIDGVGGYEGGEVAAAIAKNTIIDYLGASSGNILTTLQEAFIAANEKIIAQKRNGGANDQMACVLTVALVEKRSNRFFYAHVGDTRLYLFRDGSLVKITSDHSFVGFLEDNGRLTEEAAMAHPKRNEINKALGFEMPIAADYIQTGESPFLPGDLLLLCSDGLTDMLDKAAMTAILASGKSLEQMATVLIEKANVAGGKDNITAVLVRHEQQPATQQAVKPALLKKNVAEDAPLKQTIQQKENSEVEKPKNTNRLLLLLTVLTLLSLAGFLWQWLKKDKVENEVLPVVAESRYTTAERLLRDTLQRGVKVLVLDSTPFGDTIVLKNTLLIGNDSVWIKGNGNSILLGDTATADLRIYLLPTVRYLLLDSLVLHNVLLSVEEKQKSVLHFKDVRFINAGVQLTNGTHLSDTILSGGFSQAPLRKDSLTKPARQ